MYAEVIANPSGEIADLAGLATVAHDAGVPLVVDATVATPVLCRPIEHGADIVVHSATKFIGGHGTTLGGVVVDSGRFDWGAGKFPQLTEPVASYGGLSWWGNFGEFGFLTKLRSEQLRDLGASLAPQSRVPAAAGSADTATADGRARGERPPGGPVVGGRPSGRVRALGRASLAPSSRPGSPVPSRRTGGGLRVRRQRWQGRRRAIHQRRPTRQPSGQHR